MGSGRARLICTSCHTKQAEEGKEECFRCRVLSVGFSYVGGGGYGRETFHRRTTQEYINENVPPGAVPVEKGVWS